MWVYLPAVAERAVGRTQAPQRAGLGGQATPHDAGLLGPGQHDVRRAIPVQVDRVLGDDGVALGTNDGGATMVKLKTQTKKDLRALSFLDERTGIVVGQTGTVLKFVRTY